MAYDRGAHVENLKFWLEEFSRFMDEDAGIPVNYDFAYIDVLDQRYGEFIDEFIKPFMKNGGDSLIDHHKIASAMEGVVMHVRPIQDAGNFDFHINSQFAFFIAKSIILQWLEEDEIAILEANPDLFEIQPFAREHMVWLQGVQPDNFPVFSNAATWCLYEREIKLRIQYFKDTGKIPPL